MGDDVHLTAWVLGIRADNSYGRMP